MASAMEARSLYRSLLREARRFPDYNIREYIARRCRQGFEASKAGGGRDLLAFGEEQLELVRRQSQVYGMYAPKIKNVMEIKVSKA
ncbi:protein bcn92-like [Selaginella moellendorffii]|uniref:protein bcn92-like n=1 Tax=Selaginella moellendorffii TaxID=88036 RepID=UPI000D1C328B|nr:protein bcn92-like [Selaginella moellendorffii]|eukprot:XP_024515447.1 protein bcn92-like [Selaginella moellendorffii]